MDVLLILLGAALLIVALWALMASRGGGPRRDSRPLGLRSAREIVEDRVALEEEDLAQMLAASNARRRRRGEPERTARDIELLVAAEVRDRRAGVAAPDDDAGSERDDLDDLLAVTNARRRARGLSDRTRAQARSDLSR